MSRSFRNALRPGWYAYLTAAYAAWSTGFIFRSSFIAIDGHRYFSLFDDAMISMRYAWNLSHGLGPVWNPGQRVEGYTNPLMVALMAVPTAVLSKTLAVLGVQICGVILVLCSAWCVVLLTRALGLEERIARIAFLCTLLYYPLSFWSLMGMETGILTLLTVLSVLFAVRTVQTHSSKSAVAVACALGLAFLARPDAAIIAGIVFAYLAIRSRRGLVMAGPVYVVFVTAQEAFRWLYYGTLVPNTYTLKVAGLPLAIRLVDGVGFIGSFLASVSIMGAIAVIWTLSRRQPELWLLIAIPLMLLAYQVWAGGDPWPYWRLMTPGMPLLWTAFSAGLSAMANRFHAWRLVLGFVLIAAVIAANRDYWAEATLASPAYTVPANRANMNDALAIEALTWPNASVGVFYAGLVPYYTGRRAIDFLGKSDRHIAQLPPDVSGDIAWNGMKSVPGHNKYDLVYSIEGLRPTSVEGFAWGRDNLIKWGKQHYVAVLYRGAVLYLDESTRGTAWSAIRGAHVHAVGAR